VLGCNLQCVFIPSPAHITHNNNLTHPQSKAPRWNVPLHEIRYPPAGPRLSKPPLRAVPLPSMPVRRLVPDPPRPNLPDGLPGSSPLTVGNAPTDKRNGGVLLMLHTLLKKQRGVCEQRRPPPEEKKSPTAIVGFPLFLSEQTAVLLSLPVPPAQSTGIQRPGPKTVAVHFQRPTPRKSQNTQIPAIITLRKMTPPPPPNGLGDIPVKKTKTRPKQFLLARHTNEKLLDAASGRKAHKKTWAGLKRETWRAPILRINVACNPHGPLF